MTRLAEIIRRCLRRMRVTLLTAIGRGSSTRVSLLGLQVTLVTMAVLVLVTTVWSFSGVRGAAGEISTRTAPGLLDVVSARDALAAADRAAVASFSSNEAQLVGPGGDYQNELAVANQDLARAAEHDVVGAGSGRGVQFLAGLLTVYSGWMGQADAHFRGENDTTLAVIDLWYASRLLHDDGEGILRHLDNLATDQRAKLDEQLVKGWMHPAVMLVWALPALILLALLGYVQVLLAFRFRRRLNPWLVGATGLLVGLVVCTALGFLPASDTRAAANTLYQTVPVPPNRAVMERGEFQAQELVRDHCGRTGQPGCGETLNSPGSGSPPASEPERLNPRRADEVTRQFARAGDVGLLPVVIPLLGSSIVLLVLIGLQKRINEYRYR